MIKKAVTPIDNPPRRPRTKSDEIACLKGDCGKPKSTPNKHADTMNAPSKPASIRYSGQWRRKQVRELSSRRCGAAVDMAVTAGAGVAFVLPEERGFGRVLSINTYFADAPATGA